MNFSRERVIVSMATSLAAVAVAAAFAGGQPVNTDHRILKASRGKSIPAQLNGNEKIVTVSSSVAPPLMVSPPADRDPLVWLSGVVDAVLVVEVVERKGAFTAEQDWVQTRVTAKIVEVLKRSDKKRFNVTESLTFVEEGGTVALGKAEIRAVVPWADPVAVGSQYLAFVNLTDDGSLVVGSESFYKRTPAGFEALLDNPPVFLDRFGPSPEAVIHKMRAISR